MTTDPTLPHRPTRPRVALLVVMAALFLAGACSGSDDDVDVKKTSTTGPDDTTETTSDPTGSTSTTDPGPPTSTDETTEPDDPTTSGTGPPPTGTATTPTTSGGPGDLGAFCTALDELEGLDTQLAEAQDNGDLEGFAALYGEYDRVIDEASRIAPPAIRQDTRTVAVTIRALVDDVEAAESVEDLEAITASEEVQQAGAAFGRLNQYGGDNC